MACRPCPVQIGWTRANDGVATENAVLQGVACALNCRMTVPSNVEHSRFLSGSSSGSRRPVVSVNIREHSARRPLRRKHPALSISSTSPREKSYVGPNTRGTGGGSGGALRSGSVPSFSARPLLLYDPSRAKDEGDHDGSFVPSAQGCSGAAGGNRSQASEGAAGASGAGQPVRATLGSDTGTKLT